MSQILSLGELAIIIVFLAHLQQRWPLCDTSVSGFS
jgi:hypothetical protein